MSNIVNLLNTDIQYKSNQGADFWMSKKLKNYKNKLKQVKSLSATTSHADNNDENSIALSANDLLILSEYKRSISNFVKIVVNKSPNRKRIPVKFKTNSQSYTDGDSVVIRADIDDGNIDPTCGLALHEASHILLTDFHLLKRINEIIQKIQKKEIDAKSISKGDMNIIYNFLDEKLIKLAKNKGLSGNITSKNGKVEISSLISLVKYFHSLVNWIEDRRIDNFVMSMLPGFKVYYKSLYDTYFNSKEADEFVKSDKGRDETLMSYQSRIINLLNKNVDLSALKGLKKIYNIIDINNINRLNNINDSIAVASDVLEVILNNIENIDLQDIVDELEKKIENGEIDPLELGDGDGDGSESTNSTMIDISDLPSDIADEIKKKLKEQRKFTKGKIDDGANMSESDTESIDRILDKKMEIVSVDASYDKKEKNNNSSPSLNFDDKYAPHNFNVIVQKNINIDYFNSDNFYFKSNHPTLQDAVNRGLKNGRILARKLKVRDDEISVRFPRRKKGKIGRRLLSEAPYNDSIFESKYTKKYNNAILYISIDASSSMNWNTTGSSNKFEKCIELATAVAVAAKLTRKLDVSISLRGDGNDPMNVEIYDSRMDDINKIKKIFPYLKCYGGTPEGLCYAAFSKYMLNSSNDLNSYFLNLSDGCPNYLDYSGLSSAQHTKYEVNKMRMKGIKILSYFINTSNYSNDYSYDQFKIMYGKDAKIINLDNISEVSKTLNDLFLSKN